MGTSMVRTMTRKAATKFGGLTRKMAPNPRRHFFAGARRPPRVKASTYGCRGGQGLVSKRKRLGKSVSTTPRVHPIIG